MNSLTDKQQAVYELITEVKDDYGERNNLQYKGYTMRSKLEVQYAMYLDLLKRDEEILEWIYEPETFNLAPNLKIRRTYKPDFKVIRPKEKGSWRGRTIELHEVKGYGRCHKCGAPNSAQREKGVIKFEAAANLYSDQYKFVLVEWKDKAWHFREIK
jgi:hypothetical protein